VLQQNEQNPERLFAQANPDAVFAQLTGADVQLEGTEASQTRP
jgi:hypothetical protein